MAKKAFIHLGENRFRAWRENNPNTDMRLDREFARYSESEITVWANLIASHDSLKPYIVFTWVDANGYEIMSHESRQYASDTILTEHGARIEGTRHAVQIVPYLD